MAIEIVSFPINSMVIFQFVMWTFTRPGTNSYWMAWSSTKLWETSARHGWGEFHRWDLLVDQVARLVGALGALGALLLVNAVRLRSKTPMFFRCVSSIQNGGWSDGWWMDLFHLNRYDENWLVVWNIFYFPINWEYSNHFNWLIFFRGVGEKPPTRSSISISTLTKNLPSPPQLRTQNYTGEVYQAMVTLEGQEEPGDPDRAGGTVCDATPNGSQLRWWHFFSSCNRGL